MGGWTQTPNFIYDLMPEMKEAEIKVVMLIVRQTIGWQRESVSLSVSDFKRMTGLAQASVVSGIKAALDHGIIERTEDKNSYIYKIIEPACQPESIQILNRFEEPVQILNGNGSHSEPITVQNLNQEEPETVQNLNDTNIKINTNKQTTKAEEIAADAAPPSPPESVSVSEKPKPKRSRKPKAPPSSENPPREPTEWQDFVGAFCWLCYGHKEVRTLTKAQQGALTSEAKQVHGDGYTVKDLREWYKLVWPQSWQWKKDKSRPKPADVRSSIAQLRAETPEGFEVQVPVVNGSNAAHNRQALANVINRMKAGVNGHG